MVRSDARRRVRRRSRPPRSWRKERDRDPQVKNGRLFDNQGPRGSYDWFERRVVSPDGVLQDFALAFFPEEAALAGLEHRWLRDVATMAPGARVPDSELEAACPDVNAR